MAEERPEEQEAEEVKEEAEEKAAETAETAVEQAAEPEAPAPAPGQTYPSVEGLKCPDCGGTDLQIIGIKGSAGGVAASIAFGAAANFIMDANSKGNFELKPVKYRCKSCKKKFEALPLEAPVEELLEEPCTINFTRQGSLIGCAVTQQVYLNGVKVDNVKNGKTITFQTYTKHNVMFVTDQTGTAFPGDYKFEAESGGTENVSFKRKFL